MIDILIPWEDAEDLRPSRGDIIDFARVGYMHNAVYVGNGNVVHKTGKSHSWKAKIKCESLISKSLRWFQSWRLESPTTPQFVQQHALSTIKENSKAPHSWPFARGSTGRRASIHIMPPMKKLASNFDGSNSITVTLSSRAVPIHNP